MPSAETILEAYRAELHQARCSGLAGVAETFRLTKVYCALLRLIIS